jgi:hypothetical protein
MELILNIFIYLIIKDNPPYWAPPGGEAQLGLGTPLLDKGVGAP